MEDMDFGRCYAIEFDNGTVKIGKTINIVDRIRTHRGNAARFNVGIMSMIFTDVIPLHSDMERKILSDACSICDPTKSNEYFNGITIHDCMGFFHSYGVNYVRTNEVPRIDTDGRLLVSISQVPDISIYKDKAIAFKSEATYQNLGKSVDQLTRERILYALSKEKGGLPPSVIAQKCKSKKIGIDTKQTLISIGGLCKERVIEVIKVKHGKTGLESIRYRINKENGDDAFKLSVKSSIL